HTYTEVTGFLREGKLVTGVVTRDTMTGEETTIGCQAVINATGAWSGFVAKLLDVEVKVVPVKGVMVVLSHRLAHAAINRCHEPRDGVTGFTSIVGGKVTTYRLMAERVTDLVAHRLGVTTPCNTADVPLNDRDDDLDQLRHRPAQMGLPKPHGDEDYLKPLVCECEL